MNKDTVKFLNGNRNYRLIFRDFWTVYCLLGRRKDLTRLVEYSRRKRISGPSKHYGRLLADDELRLGRYRMRAPRLVALASLSYRLNKLIFPTPKYFSSGTAKAYRTQNLTKSKSWLSLIPRQRNK